MKLPEAFVDRMKRLLGDEYTEFAAAYDKERLYALRYNPLKSNREDFLKRIPFNLTPVAWCSEGFYYDKCANATDSADMQPGKHPFHEAGAYYIQEPSAMAAAEALEPKAGEKILDLCAAPGGKTTHIAGKMMGKGLIVSNEIVPDRARILSQNVERMGIPNVVVCNETPDRLARFFPMFFDRILVDAPCSGEGMFRKDETAIDMWSLENVEMCADRQLDILEHAAKMLKSGGVLVYSTCTFSPQENEGVISEFIRRHDEFVVEETKLETFFSQGEGKWIENPAEGIEHTMRLWPHKIAGEGHFIAKLRKADGLTPKPLQIKEQSTDGIKLCREFLEKELGISNQVRDELEQNGRFILFGEQIYLVPADMIPLKGIKVIRAGLHLGMNKKNRFEPAHALALYLSHGEIEKRYEMTKEETAKYLRGETFSCDTGLKGWMLLTTSGYSIGFGKAGGGQMKNHYPKGLRKLW
ncbi:MAG: NOL1/NOP2/sun family putative RNA methylase [Lachnospiraceae bacterium]|nr:NOL1/NOP2/sun family putative RNA methylase [Lachnospiraceae bacterium]